MFFHRENPRRKCELSRVIPVILVGMIVCWGGPVAEGAEPKVGASFDEKADCRFPDSPQILDVTRPPYNAKGDGITDDTAAIQKALSDMMGQHKVLYFPNGTYLVSATLKWSNQNSKKQAAWGFNWLQGQNVRKTVIRLKDETFTDPKKPAAIMWCGGFGSADWFHNYIQNITFDVGRKNTGAIGLQFYSNNTGALREVAIQSQDGLGVAGLDLSHRDMNGPLLVRHVEVRGFEVGVSTGRAVNSQTFEFLSLKGQSRFGFDNHGQAISIRGLKSENEVPAVRSYGTLSLLDAVLEGGKGAKNLPAIVNYNGGRLALRDVVTSGYGRALADVTTPDYAAALRVSGTDKLGSEGPRIQEYFSHAVTSPFRGPSASLRLPVEETPEVPWDDPKSWAVVDSFGADPTGKKDSSAAIQKAIDSGATTIFFPGFYTVEKPFIVRGKVRRLLGTGAWIDYNRRSQPDLIIEEGEAKVVVIEHFAPINGGIEIRTNRTVVVKSVEAKINYTGKGRLFLEDVATSDLRIKAGQQVWARQLNIENEGTHLLNEAGQVWVLGYKTERGGTLLHTKGGGQSEVFGTFSYTTTAGKLAPMFVTEDASTFAFFNEICFNGDPFRVLIRETRKGTTQEIKRDAGSTTPYIGTEEKK